MKGIILAGEVRHSQAATDKAQSLLGYAPRPFWRRYPRCHTSVCPSDQRCANLRHALVHAVARTVAPS